MPGAYSPAFSTAFDSTVAGSAHSTGTKTAALAGMGLSRRGATPPPPGVTDRIRRNKRLSDPIE